MLTPPPIEPDPRVDWIVLFAPGPQAVAPASDGLLLVVLAVLTAVVLGTWGYWLASVYRSRHSDGLTARADGQEAHRG